MNMANLKGSTKFGEIPVGKPAFMSISAGQGLIEEKDDMVSLGFCLCHVYGKQLALPWLTKETEKMKPSKAFSAIQKIKEKAVKNNQWVGTKSLFN